MRDQSFVHSALGGHITTTSDTDLSSCKESELKESECVAERATPRIATDRACACPARICEGGAGEGGREGSGAGGGDRGRWRLPLHDRDEQQRRSFDSAFGGTVLDGLEDDAVGRQAAADRASAARVPASGVEHVAVPLLGVDRCMSAVAKAEVRLGRPAHGHGGYWQ